MKKSFLSSGIIEQHSAMNLYQLGEIVIKSSRELLENGKNQGDCMVFFGDEHKFFREVNVKLRRNSDNNSYILVFELSD